MPALRWRRPFRKAEEELTYFLQGKSRLSGALHHSQTVDRTIVVAAPAVLAHRRRENPDLFVVANSGRAQTKHPRNIGNRHVFGHSEI